jgi:hypothetical protein
MGPAVRGIGQQAKIVCSAVVLYAETRNLLIDTANNCRLRLSYHFPRVGALEGALNKAGLLSAKR